MLESGKSWNCNYIPIWIIFWENSNFVGINSTRKKKLLSRYLPLKFSNLQKIIAEKFEFSSSSKESVPHQSLRSMLHCGNWKVQVNPNSCRLESNIQLWWYVKFGWDNKSLGKAIYVYKLVQRADSDSWCFQFCPGNSNNPILRHGKWMRWQSQYSLQIGLEDHFLDSYIVCFHRVHVRTFPIIHLSVTPQRAYLLVLYLCWLPALIPKRGYHLLYPWIWG